MRRWFWLATGFGLGVAAARRSRRRAGAAGSPRAGGMAARVRAHVNDAVAEGRKEAQRRERALRDVLASPSEGAREPEQ